MVVIKSTNTRKKKVCNVCAVDRRMDEYYKISQPDANFPDGHLNVCKECYRETWEDEFQGFANFVDFLRAANLPYKSEIYSASKDKLTYIRTIRGRAYGHLRHKDSDSFIEEKAQRQIKASQLEELTEEQVKECELFWGRGYSEEEYLYLMNQYADYEHEYDLSSKPMRDIIAQICLAGLSIRKSYEAGKDVTREQKAFQDLLGSANLKPAQEKASAENEANTFGTFIKKIEDEMPIAAPLPEYQDPDGIIKFIKVFYTGATAVSMGEENPYPEEYEEVMQEYTVGYDDPNVTGESNG